MNGVGKHEITLEEKRVVPVTIWIAPSEAARVQLAIDRLCSEGRFHLTRPKVSVVCYGVFRSGLTSFEASESKIVSPSIKPEGKILRRKQPSGARK